MFATAAAIVAGLQGVVQLANLAVQAGKDASPFIDMIGRFIGGKRAGEVTQADLAKMAEESEKLADEFMLPIQDSERQKPSA